MKKLTFALIGIFSSIYMCSMAQKIPTKPSDDELKTERKAKLKEITTRRQPLNDTLFFETVYADFTKLLQTEAPTGKPLNFASIDITKPKAQVNYAFGPKKKKKWFINIGAGGGVEDGLISLLENQKPAKAYSANVSFSHMIYSKYRYRGEDNYALKSQIENEFEKLCIYEYELKRLAYYQHQLNTLDSLLGIDHNAIENKKTTEAQHQVHRDSIELRQSRYASNYKSKAELAQSINDRKAKLDSIYKTMHYPSKHLFWFTLGQKAGGNSFRFYDAANPEKTIANKKSNRQSYQTAASVSYYYKNANRNFISLLNLGVEAGSYNNFAELTGSEFKTVAKKEIVPDTYTKSDSYTVYDPSEYKFYHAVKPYVEAYLLFDQNGNFGLRAKYLFDMPCGEDKSTANYRRSQQDAEIGFVINTSSKAKPDSPISFEVYYGFNDIGGRQDGATGKFYKRSEIGIKTAIPFNF
jgi:hypothetical protein